MTLAVVRNFVLFFCALVAIARANTPAHCGMGGFGKLGALPDTRAAELPEFPATRPLRIEDRHFLDRLFAGCQPDCSQFNFTALWGWHPHDQYEVSRAGNAVLISMKGPNGRIFLQPLGVTPERAAEAIHTVLEHDRTSFSHVSKIVADALKSSDKVKLTEQRDLAEYVYNATDLRDLQRHKDLRYKKKQVDEFFSLHPTAKYVSLNEHPELLPKVAAFLERWTRARESDGAIDPKSRAEAEASRITIEHFKEFGLKGGALVVDGEIAAFSIGSKVNDRMFAIYTEKADPAKFKGSYAAINQQFATDIAASGFTHINRMDDWGVPGLRRAKQSYQPVFLVENFRVERAPAGSQ